MTFEELIELISPHYGDEGVLKEYYIDNAQLLQRPEGEDTDFLALHILKKLQADFDTEALGEEQLNDAIGIIRWASEKLEDLVDDLDDLDIEE